MVTEIDIVIVDSITVGCEITLGVLRSHASLENLDYAHSGHTGFASSADLALKLSKDNFGWVIADNTYNPAYTYSVGDTVYYDGYLYTCDVAVPTPEPFDYSKWSKITLERLIWYKQDKLTAGTGISITGNVISATGGGSSGFGFIEVSAASGVPALCACCMEKLAPEVEGRGFDVFPIGMYMRDSYLDKKV